MPRYARYNPTKSVAELRQRGRSYHISGTKGFIDPYPVGFGTLPEKMVYYELSRRGIRFYYLNDLEINIPEIDLLQFFQADFILPDLKVIIEVQGAHWHSQPASIESDALKFAYYQQMGWRPLAWWDFDILENITKLFLQDPALAAYGATNSGSTELAPMRRTKTDSSQGIRTVNARRAIRLQYRKRAAVVRPRTRNHNRRYSIYVR